MSQTNNRAKFALLTPTQRKVAIAILKLVSAVKFLWIKLLLIWLQIFMYCFLSSAMLIHCVVRAEPTMDLVFLLETLENYFFIL